MTLFAEDPMAVYYRARGVQLETTFTEMLYQYPLGAGLGRWGMAGGYFGTAGQPGLWAEIQIAGWMIDGGVPMIFLYGGAIVVGALAQFRLARLTQLSAHRGLRGGRPRGQPRDDGDDLQLHPLRDADRDSVLVPRGGPARGGLQLPAAGCMSRWLLIAGDFTPLGGMDRANYALASSLAAAPGADVHLVAHRVWPDLERDAWGARPPRATSVRIAHGRGPAPGRRRGAAGEGVHRRIGDCQRRQRGRRRRDVGPLPARGAHAGVARVSGAGCRGAPRISTTCRANAGRCGTRGSCCATARARPRDVHERLGIPTGPHARRLLRLRSESVSTW